MKQIMNFILGVFLLYCMVFPVYNMNFDFKIDQKKWELSETKKEDFSEKIESQKKTIIKDCIKEELEKIFLKEKIEMEKIEIFMDINQNNCISINKILVVIKEKTKENFEKAKKIVSENTETKEVTVS